jgi:hypothetical protein
MKIDKQEYDQLPFAIRTGALILWGTQLVSYSRAGLFRQLYSFSGFFAEMCFDEHEERLDCIYTFSDIQQLEPYIKAIQWQEFLA